MEPTLKLILIVVLFGLAAVAPFAGKSLFDEWWSDVRPPKPQISMRRVAFFYVEVEKDFYQVGAVIRLINLGDKPYQLKGLSLDAAIPTIYGRGVSRLLSSPLIMSRYAELREDNLIKAASDATFKFLLPIKLNLAIEHQPPPGVVFVGDWSLLLTKGSAYRIAPDFFGTYDKTISSAEWGQLARSGSGINIDDISYQRLPPPAPPGTPVTDAILFNRDRTAKFTVYSFDSTPPVTASFGALVLVRGRGLPPLEDGWELMARTFEEIFTDPQKLERYNKIFPPDDEGRPRRFGSFM